MHISRAARIKILLVIDVLFFLVELTVGYAVGSLALVADSFHMLSDILSLLVALYAIKLTTENAADSRYSYGWHRAEILAALINGVFLLALCFSIFLEALQRFFSIPEIDNPRLVVIVGSLGLASNVVGLFLFHEHSHSHSHSHSHPSRVIASGQTTPTKQETQPGRSVSPSCSSSDTLSSLYGHAAATRSSFVQGPVSATSESHLPAQETSAEVHSLTSNGLAETAPLLDDDEEGTLSCPASPISQFPSEPRPHAHPHTHSGSMNMHGILLHVLGDALGNIGVISTGLIIWLTSWSFKYYLDPVISLIITCIIFSSALPLVHSASFVLLQAVPPTISLDDVRQAILDVEGVLSLHELHIWRLSETKVIASVHVMASRRFDFMPVAARIRNTLHLRGIHSCTIQPEYAKTSHPDGYLVVKCLIPLHTVINVDRNEPTVRHQRSHVASCLVPQIRAVIRKRMRVAVSPEFMC
ncbi:cation efflux protein [Marasmius fiardii PR-910]|nr:cation efflux protein [Marasmius fiardii PR-910]